MERRGHYLKGASRATVPGVLFAVCVSTTVLPIASRHFSSRRIWRSATAMVSYRRRGRWSAPQTVTVGTPAALMEWMRARSSPRRTNWVVSPCASDTLTLMGWWDYAESRGATWDSGRCRAPAHGPGAHPDGPIEVRRLVVRGVPDIIDYRDHGRRWVWVSGTQYFPDGPGPAAADADAGPGAADAVPHRTGVSPGIGDAGCALWHASVRGLIDWWSEHAGAPWGLTAGQLAVGLLRTHAPTRVLCTHSHPETHELEREASYGARASVWFAGQAGSAPRASADGVESDGGSSAGSVRGPVTLLDCRSMYPSLLRDRSYPVRLIGYREAPRAGEPQELAEHVGVIARVTIRTSAAEYPMRAGGLVRYPLGQFTTTLTGPELLSLRGCGEVLQCHAMSLYAMGRPFALAADALLSARSAARTAQDAGGELFAKLCANSLAGKLAQKRGGWERDTGADGRRRWGELYHRDGRTGAVAVYRYICGFAWRWVDDREHAGPFAAAFAYLVAYGRLMMRRLREACPPHTVVSQDTDGIWCLPAAVDALACLDVPAGDHPGELAVKHVAQSARFIGPRHYCVDGQWVLSGYSDHRMDGDGEHVWQVIRDRLWGSNHTSPPACIRETNVRATLPSDLYGGLVGEDGWITPHTVGTGEWWAQARYDALGDTPDRGSALASV